jgi:asparagine synthase (glutamine-hydrolysing)
MSREHVTVALSGEGADELFGGYSTYLADRYSRTLRRSPAALRRFALAALRYWPVSDNKISFEYKLKRFLEGSFLPPKEAHLFWNGAFTESQKRALCDGLTGHGLDLVAEAPDAADAGELNRFLWLDQLYYLPDDILYKCDRMSMAHSLEVRPPFLDHRIVEFAASLPYDLKIRGSRLKYVLKELMRDKLPQEILSRPKEGFDIPAHQWFRGPLRSLLLETLSEAAVRQTGIFHWDEISRLVGEHLDRRANLGYHLWGLVTLFLWMRRWRIQVGAPPALSADTVSLTSAVN